MIPNHDKELQAMDSGSSGNCNHDHQQALPIAIGQPMVKAPLYSQRKVNILGVLPGLVGDDLFRSESTSPIENDLDTLRKSQDVIQDFINDLTRSAESGGGDDEPTMPPPDQDQRSGDGKSFSS